MAYRCSLFDQIGYFDTALDVGTITNGGGDLEMFFRTLKEEHALVYEPGAVVRHCHRNKYAQLRTQITNWGIGFYSYLVCNILAYPDERLAFIRLGLWWLWRQYIRRLLVSFIRPDGFPCDLILAELCGCFKGLSRYRKSQRIASRIARIFGPIPSVPIKKNLTSQKTQLNNPNAIAIRIVDLSQSLYALTDVQDYSHVRIHDYKAASQCLCLNSCSNM